MIDRNIPALSSHFDLLKMANFNVESVKREEERIRKGMP